MAAPVLRPPLLSGTTGQSAQLRIRPLLWSPDVSIHHLEVCVSARLATQGSPQRQCTELLSVAQSHIIIFLLKYASRFYLLIDLSGFEIDLVQHLCVTSVKSYFFPLVPGLLSSTIRCHEPFTRQNYSYKNCLYVSGNTQLLLL